MRLAAVALAALAVVAALAAPAAAQRHTIVIDPGHGGGDPGGVGTGMQEKAIVLDVSLRFRELLQADDADAGGGGEWSVKLTRDDDTFVELSARAAYANSVGADRFLSIHSNAFSDPGANGTETFSLSDSGQGAALRDLVQDEMIAAWGRTNRGNKTASFAVLRDTAMPAELHELAFITNAADAAYLGSPEERQKAAVAHLRALQRHYGLAPYLPGAGPATGAVAGTVSGPDGPLAGAAIEVGGREATSGADGAFAVDGVAAGSHELVVSADGYLTSRTEIAIAAGETTELDVTLEPGDSDGGGDGDGGGGGGAAQGDLVSGCAAGGGGGAGVAGALVLIGLAVLVRRRR